MKDTDSSNGTFVNGKRLGKGETTEIYLGDIILLADEKFTVVK